MKGHQRTTLIRNKRARFEYEILETFEAGLVLKGSEVKSLRQGRASLAEAYGRVAKGEVFLQKFHIAPYDAGSRAAPDPLRPKKLLLHKSEIRRLVGRLSEKGLALIPLSVYFKGGYAKVKLGLGHGKKLFDKRRALKEKEAQREISRGARRKRLR